MQVLKKIALFFLCLGLFGCNSPLTDNRIELSDQRYDIIDYDAINKSMVAENPLNVAVLLPLTGKRQMWGWECKMQCLWHWMIYRIIVWS